MVLKPGRDMLSSTRPNQLDYKSAQMSKAPQHPEGHGMDDVTAPWIQSLLLLTPWRAPSPEHVTPSSTTAATPSRGVAAQSSGYAQPESDLGQNGMFWPAQFHLFRKPLAVVGNELVVHRLPMTIHFILHCVVWATDRVNVSWTVQGPYISSEHPISTLTALMNKQVRVKPIGAPLIRTTHLGIGIVHEGMRPHIEEPGLYFVRVQLNGQEAGKAPLFVRLPFKQTPEQT